MTGGQFRGHPETIVIELHTFHVMGSYCQNMVPEVELLCTHTSALWGVYIGRNLNVVFAGHIVSVVLENCCTNMLDVRWKIEMTCLTQSGSGLLLWQFQHGFLFII